MKATIQLEVTKKEVIALSNAVSMLIYDLEDRLEKAKDPISQSFYKNKIERYEDLSITLDSLI